MCILVFSKLPSNASEAFLKAKISPGIFVGPNRQKMLTFQIVDTIFEQMLLAPSISSFYSCFCENVMFWWIEKLPFWRQPLHFASFKCGTFSCSTLAFWRFMFTCSLDLDTFGLKKSVTLLLIMLLEYIVEGRDRHIVSTLM